MNDLEAAKKTEPSLVIIPLTTTFELLRISPSDTARFLPTLDRLSSQSLRQSINHPLTRPSESDSAALTAYEKASGEGYVSITRTGEEISLLLNAKLSSQLKEDAEWTKGCDEGVIEQEGPYACLRVRGPMPLRESTEILLLDAYRRIGILITIVRILPSSVTDLTGIAANFTKTLQQHAIAVFLISTWQVH